MATIALLHRHYDEAHLAKVQEQMATMGAPRIRAIWSECCGCWMAVEGCHRLRAAAALGLTPVIVDVTAQRTVRIQSGGEQTRISVKRLLEEQESMAHRLHVIDYSEEE